MRAWAMGVTLALAMMGCVGQTATFDPLSGSTPRQCEVPIPDGGMLLVYDLDDAGCEAQASATYPDAGTD